MVRFELSLDIARPAHEVWAYLTDPEHVPEWQSSAESSHQVSEGPMGDEPITDSMVSLQPLKLIE